MRDQAETFEKLAELHNSIYVFRAKLDAIDSVDENHSKLLLDEANKICSPCGAAYGEYTYLFEAAGVRFGEIYKNFWDRIEKKGEYAE